MENWLTWTPYAPYAITLLSVFVPSIASAREKLKLHGYVENELEKLCLIIEIGSLENRVLASTLFAFLYSDVTVLSQFATRVQSDRSIEFVNLIAALLVYHIIIAVGFYSARRYFTRLRYIDLLPQKGILGRSRLLLRGIWVVAPIVWSAMFLYACRRLCGN
jgi:hypothetical protein